MKPRRLFTKIYLTYIGLLLVVTLAIFLLFHAIEGEQHDRDEARLLLEAVRQLVADQLKNESELSANALDKIAALLTTISRTTHSHYWLIGAGGNVIFTTYPGQPPKHIAFLIKTRTDGEYVRHMLFKPDPDIYGSAPIPWQSDTPVRIHFVVSDPHNHFRDFLFGLGLIFIVVLIGLLSLPLSRSISRPVMALHESAHRIADGDLDHRAKITTQDEIGEMGEAFNQMADSLSKMIKSGRDLLTNVSHELRSPLARIRVAQELIQDRLNQRGDREVDKYLSAMQREVEEMDLLVGKILLLSKRDITDTKNRNEEFDLAQMVKDQLARMDSLFQARNITVKADLPGRFALKGDRDALGLAISNVLDNMGRYADEKGVAGVSLVRENGRTALRFFNTCPKLSNDDLRRMFQPFQRLSGSKGQGTGLGLAIAIRTLESIGWSIEAENINDGICITLRGPV
jgi:signal transduction histidine kinase